LPISVHQVEGAHFSLFFLLTYHVTPMGVLLCFFP